MNRLSFSRSGIFIAAWIIFSAVGLCGIAPAQSDQDPKTLLDYIETLKWDPAVKGPLLAIEPKQVRDDFDERGEAEVGLAAYNRRLVNVGTVSVFAPTTLFEDEPQKTSIFDYLDRDQKIAALLANLSDPQFKRLSEGGICAEDLTGDARTALLALIPERVDIRENRLDANGNGLLNDPVWLTDSDRMKLRFELCRAYEVNLSRNLNQDNSESGPSFCSIDNHSSGPVTLDSEALSASNSYFEPYKEQTSEVTEKSYKFDWTNIKLKQRLTLNQDETIGDLVDRIRDTTGLEVYADQRIAHFTLHSIGSWAQCGLLLHALAIAADGVIRQVGPAFVLTNDLEGDATKRVRLAGQEFVARRQVEPLVAGWIKAINERELYKKIDFLDNDSLASVLTSKDTDQPKDGPPKDRKLNSFPSNLQRMAQRFMSSQTLDDSSPRIFYDRATVSNQVFTRWILPDGRALPAGNLNDLPGVDTVESEDESQDAGVPVEASDLALGSAVEISPPDVESAKLMAKSLIEFGLKEIWLDSVDPAVIQATIKVFGKISLVIRPWRAIQDEPLASPDLSVLGLTGFQTAGLPKGTLVTEYDNYPLFSNTFSPHDPQLDAHWAHLCSIIPKAGLSRIIVLDPEVGGYVARSPRELYGGPSSVFTRHQFTFGSLVDQDPDINDFGYTLSARLEFLRQHRVDPIDLTMQIRMLSLAIDEAALPRGSIFHNNRDLNKYWNLWNQERQNLAASCLHVLTTKLSGLPNPVFYQVSAQPQDGMMGYLNPRKQVETSVDGKPIDVTMCSVGPDYSEDEEGNLVDFLDTDEPICIDFRLAPKDLDRYLKHFFAPPKTKSLTKPTR